MTCNNLKIANKNEQLPKKKSGNMGTRGYEDARRGSVVCEDERIKEHFGNQGFLAQRKSSQRQGESVKSEGEETTTRELLITKMRKAEKDKMERWNREQEWETMNNEDVGTFRRNKDKVNTAENANAQGSAIETWLVSSFVCHVRGQLQRIIPQPFSSFRYQEARWSHRI